METSALEQENVSLKEHIEKEMSSVNDKKQCHSIDNENLIFLQQKGFKKTLTKNRINVL